MAANLLITKGDYTCIIFFLDSLFDGFQALFLFDRFLNFFSRASLEKGFIK